MPKTKTTIPKLELEPAGCPRCQDATKWIVGAEPAGENAWSGRTCLTIICDTCRTLVLRVRVVEVLGRQGEDV